nr:transposase (putative), gypsy type [Tanacetum cinerariifolium]
MLNDIVSKVVVVNTKLWYSEGMNEIHLEGRFQALLNVDVVVDCMGHEMEYNLWTDGPSIRSVDTCSDHVTLGFHARLFVLVAAKVSQFEIKCRVHGGIPTNLDSLKKWNDHFFWIKSSMVPISIPWFNGVTVDKDPPPSDDIVDLEFMDILSKNRLSFRKYPKTFLCMLKFGERTLTERDESLLKETEDWSIPPSDEIITIVDRTINDELKDATRKGKKRVAFDSALLPVKKAKTYSFTALPKKKKQNPSTGVKTPTVYRSFRPASHRFVVLSSDSLEPSNTKPYSSFMLVSNSLPVASASAPDITNDFKLDNVVVCRNFINHIPHLDYWASLSNLTDAYFFNQFNVNASRQACMGFELWLWKYWEISDLRSYLEKLEGVSIEVVRLYGRVSELKSTAAISWHIQLWSCFRVGAICRTIYNCVLKNSSPRMSKSTNHVPTPDGSVIRNTTGKGSKRTLDGPPTFMPNDKLREFCDKHYNQLLPLMAEKVHEEKLQGVQTRLDFEENLQINSYTQEKT